MAAFCACCGTEITLKPQACPICGAPRHGMSPPSDLPRTLDAEADLKDVEAWTLTNSLSRKCGKYWRCEISAP